MVVPNGGESGDGPAVLRLRKWDPSQFQLNLSEFREAFISPTREVLVLHSYQSEALLLPLIAGKISEFFSFFWMFGNLPGNVEIQNTGYFQRISCFRSSHGGFQNFWGYEVISLSHENLVILFMFIYLFIFSVPNKSFLQATGPHFQNMLPFCSPFLLTRWYMRGLRLYGKKKVPFKIHIYQKHTKQSSMYFFRVPIQGFKNSAGSKLTRPGPS